MRQKILALVPAVILLAGCAVNPASGNLNFTMVTEREEFELGHDVVQAAIEKDGLYTEKPELVNTYRELGARMVEQSERADKPFDFIIIDSPIFNAWATPGYVNFYRGILPYLNSEAELLTIMGHEVGHITARHTVRQLSTTVLAQLLVVGAAVAVAANTDNPGTAYAALGVGGLMTGIGLAAYGRGAEYEADDLGARYLERMGYPPAEAANAMRAMSSSENYLEKMYVSLHGEKPKKPLTYHIYASHPKSDTRVARLEQKHTAAELRSFERSPLLKNDTVGRAKYLKMIDGLAFGPKTEEGVATRDRLYMPKDRFMVSLPDNYYATNGVLSHGWLMADVENKSRIYVAARKYRRSAGAEEALRIFMPRGRNIKMVELPGGITAARAEIPFKRGSWERAMNALNEALFGKPDSILEGLPNGGIVYVVPGAETDDKDKKGNLLRRYSTFVFHTVKRDLTDADRDLFDKMVKSYKLLNQTEADRVEPLRIGTHTVRPGDSVASISNRMPVGYMREEFFRAINGMGEEDEVKPGMLMKVLVDKNTVR